MKKVYLGLKKKDTKMIENVKKSLDDFLDRLSPEAVDSMLAELNAEYDMLCGVDFISSFSVELEAITSVKCETPLMKSAVSNNERYDLAA